MRDRHRRRRHKLTDDGVTSAHRHRVTVLDAATLLTRAEVVKLPARKPHEVVRYSFGLVPQIAP